ncbi:hypothetical protein J4206_05485 [Candidatus Woesearchaeota archaeon]|nr:hypothetical protein [Candidatus Woesearchaeota archaeon]
MDGTELTARFSYITNSLGFCGPDKASEEFLHYIKFHDNKQKVESALKRFEGLLPYLSTIAEKTGKNLLDHDVVEAYWLGNELLENFDDTDMKSIIKKLIARGLPASIGKQLIRDLPAGFVPHHDFNVFYVGVGKTTGSVETTLQNMDNCRIGWGRVAEVLKNELIVVTSTLKKRNDRFRFGDEEIKNAVYLPEMLPDIKKGDHVALHWGFAPIVLEDHQLKNLKKYSIMILDVMNRCTKQL